MGPRAGPWTRPWTVGGSRGPWAHGRFAMPQSRSSPWYRKLGTASPPSPVRGGGSTTVATPSAADRDDPAHNLYMRFSPYGCQRGSLLLLLLPCPAPPPLACCAPVSLADMSAR
eukprot:COSAG01_NODE_694_length_14205_cov_228.163122_12_plen_114_part_00